MKKIITTLLSVSLLAGIGAAATGCGDGGDGNPGKPGTGKPDPTTPYVPDKKECKTLDFEKCKDLCKATTKKADCDAKIDEEIKKSQEPETPALKAERTKVEAESQKRKNDDKTNESKVSSATKAEDLAVEGVKTYAKIAYQAYSDALDGAKKLDTAIKAFIAAPSDTTLKAARDAWRASRPKYLQTEVFRFANGPINNYTGTYDGFGLEGFIQDTDPAKNQVGVIAIAPSSDPQGVDIEGFVNPWPLDENYIDYTKNPDDGSIYTTTFNASLIGDETNYPITFLKDKASIRGRNEGDPIAGQMCPSNIDGADDVPCDDPNANKNGDGGESEKNISTGYHAIEFMLWGQDFNNDGPGDRPVTDYTTDPKADRRKAYLNTISEILVDDLTWVVKQWDPSKTDNYQAELIKAAEDNSKIKTVYALLLAAMQQLSVNETGGERVVAALKSGNQEDEHSCFSDNTPIDFIDDVNGLLNVWYGTYTADDPANNVKGLGLKHYADKLAPELSKNLTDTLEQAEIDANLMVDKSKKTEEYFDQVIVKLPSVNPGRFRVHRFAEDLYKTKAIYVGLYKKMDLHPPKVDKEAEFDE